MKKKCCEPTQDNSLPNNLDQTNAVEERYATAAHVKEACLCTPVSFNRSLLEAIPNDVVDRDYGCGDPTRWVHKGGKVLDLGSGSGKNAFICAQAVGCEGAVIGVDRNIEMLNLARRAAPVVAAKIGYSNVKFLEGAISALDTPQSKGEPLIADSSIDIVISNCVLNLVNPSDRKALLTNIRRVLKANGRVAISDIVCNRPVPIALQEDPNLWSGCISGAWQEDSLLENFQSLGFKGVKFADRSNEPWKVIEGIEFRAVTLIGQL